MTVSGSPVRFRRPPAHAVAACALFLVAWAFLHVGIFHREYDQMAGDDLDLYQAYGSAIAHGHVPYRDFAVVYPPGALPAFAIPSLTGDYGTAFELEMLICGLAAVFLIALALPGRIALVFAGLSPVLLGDVVRTRYDFWPAVAATAALLALARDRHRLGWALLGAAIATKGYAICLVPLAVIWTARRAGRRELVCAGGWGAGVLAAVVVPFVAVAPRGVWASVREQVVRPLQIESLGGSILMSAKRAQVVGGYGSNNIAGTPAKVLAVSFELVELLALLWCWWRFARGRVDPDRLCLFAAASVAAFVAFGKVLSPQYLIWLVPLVALVRGRRGRGAIALLAAAAVLTQWWTPTRYGAYKDEFAWAWVVLGRDLVLAAIFAVLAWPAPSFEQTTPRRANADGKAVLPAR